MGKQIGAAEFKAHCLRLLDEVERTGEPITITKRGRPVGELRPAAERERKSATFGFLKGSVTFLTESDNFSPVNSDWEEQCDKKWDERGFTKR
jgi:prevent-host-death family protein